MSHLAIAYADGRRPDGAVLALFTPRIDRLKTVLIGRRDGPLGRALALSGRHLFLATTPFAHQCESEPSVLVFRRGDGLFEGRYRLGGLDDVRGMQWSEGLLRVVSAGTGEMVAFRCERGRLHFDRFVWAPDVVHGVTSVELRLGSIAEHRCDVWMTALGPADGQGIAFDLTRATVFATGLGGPGALLSDGETLWMVEAGGRCIRMIDGTRRIGLAGEPTGLARLDDRLYSSIDAKLVAVDPRVADCTAVHELGGSIADLTAVDDAGDWPDKPDVTWLDSHGLLLDRAPDEED